VSKPKGAEHVFLTESGELVVLNYKNWDQWEYMSYGGWRVDVGSIVFKMIQSGDIPDLEWLGEL